ncbi:MAG: hypothetical protein FJ264_10635 [Planctomycetes bacterium]|nr:hypothetical protein [Planctomycetota bacterium]
MDNLNACIFQYRNEPYELEFERILTGITACYKMMIKDNVSVPSNDEDRIRDVLYNNYLNNNRVRNNLKLNYYIFDCEVAEYDKNGNLAGFLDLKVSTQNRFFDSNAYYSIECKRLDNKKLSGVTGLNADYIKEGIMRFVTERYSSHSGINGMIGFVVEKINIDSNIKSINELLINNFKDANTQKKLTHVGFIKKFKHSYYSIHTDIENKKIKLYHLMFDLSKNIKGGTL